MRGRAAQLAENLDPARAGFISHRLRQPEWAVPSDHLLTLEGAWFYVTKSGQPCSEQRSRGFANAYLDALAPDAMIVRLRIHC